MSIEELWRQLSNGAQGGAQTRIDAIHPLDIYADVQPLGEVGLLALCSNRPPDVRPMRALSVERGRRTDGRWALRLSLEERQLLPVFTAFCQDIIECTRTGVDEAHLGEVIVRRLVHWRSLLERDSSGLGEAALRGLIGELLVLRDRLLPSLGLSAAVSSWRGPFGAPQDFVLPDGRHAEVKTVGRHAEQIRVNGLAQLDSGQNPLSLIVVRVEPTTETSAGAVTAPSLIASLRTALAPEPETLRDFDAALAGMGWHEHPSHDDMFVRPIGIEDHEVGPGFPRLIRATVPSGVLDAEYMIALPGSLGLAGAVQT